jgi:hypothetical protein
MIAEGIRYIRRGGPPYVLPTPAIRAALGSAPDAPPAGGTG